MTAAFTPGPWKVEDGLDPHDLQRPWVQQVADPRLYVALACGNTTADALTNARLIAAAPDLFASLIELLEPLERASAELVAHGKAADENAEAAFDRARAALAKARGDQ